MSRHPLTPPPPTEDRRTQAVGGARTIHINAYGRDITVAGGDITTSEPPRPLAEFDRRPIRSRVLGVVGAFVISVAAGLFVYYWTIYDSGPPPGPSVEPQATEAPETNADIDASGHRTGIVHGCNTYGENCEGNPLYATVPPISGYDWATFPKIATVSNSSELVARCWALGAVTTNHAANDHGPDPYSSDIYYNVQAPDDRWGYIPDTYFIRDQYERMALPKCPATA